MSALTKYLGTPKWQREEGPAEYRRNIAWADPNEVSATHHDEALATSDYCPPSLACTTMHYLQENKPRENVNSNAPKRNVSTDVARGLGMLAVVFGHSLNISLAAPNPVFEPSFALWRYISSFHMPLFFLISGMLFKPRSTQSVVSGCLSQIFTAFIVHIAAWTLFLFLHKMPLDAAYAQLLTPFVTLNGFYTTVVWFLVALAGVQFFCHLFHTAPSGRRLLAVVLPGAGFVWAQLTGVNTLQLSTIFPAMIFYGFGYFIQTRSLAEKTFYRTPLSIICMLMAVAVLAPLNTQCILEAGNQCSNGALGFAVLMFRGDYGFLPIFFITAAAGCMGTIWAADYIFRTSTHLTRVLSWIGRNTLALLILNGFVMTFIQMRWMRYPESNFTTFLIAGALTAGQIIAIRFFAGMIEIIPNSASAIAARVTHVLVIANSFRRKN